MYDPGTSTKGVQCWRVGQCRAEGEKGQKTIRTTVIAYSVKYTSKKEK